MELSQQSTTVTDAGYSVIGITYDSTAQLQRFVAKHRISFTMLSDEGSSAIRSLGLLNEEMPTDSRYFGVPYPGVFLLDAEGTILAKFAEQDYRDRPILADILQTVKSAQ